MCIHIQLLFVLIAYILYLHSNGRKIESVEILSVLPIHRYTCEIDGLEIMIVTITPYSVKKLFEFSEGNITGTIISVDIF